MKTDWLRGIPNNNEKEALEYVLKNNHILVKRILELLDQYSEEEARQQSSLSQYDSPSWQFLQADRNGAIRALKKVRSLFSDLGT